MRRRADHVAAGFERVAQGADGVGGALDLWPGGCVPSRVGRDRCGAFGAKGLDAMFISTGWEKGQGLVECALILVLVALVVIVILAVLGPIIGDVFSNIVSSI